jgi:hypothetical protein
LTAVDEAITALQGTTAKTAVQLNAGLTKACKDHVDNMGPVGAIGNIG